MPPRHYKSIADAVGPPEPDDPRKQIARERLAPSRRRIVSADEYYAAISNPHRKIQIEQLDDLSHCGFSVWHARWDLRMTARPRRPARRRRGSRAKVFLWCAR